MDRHRPTKQLLTNQPYDETLDVVDAEELEGVYGRRQVTSGVHQRGRLAWCSIISLNAARTQ